MKKPAILLITADELNKNALSCYGGEAIQTPNLDRLGEQGGIYDRAYCTSPWCLPSRCSILTGLFPHTSGAYSNFRRCELSGTIENAFTALKKCGYQTALSGKCHFAPVPYGETRPGVTLDYEEFSDYYRSLGIDRLYLQDDKQVSVWFYDDYAKELDAAGHLSAYREDIWNRELKKVFEFPAPAEWHPDAWVGKKAVEEINSADPDAPEFLWVSFSGPHYPFDAPKEYLERVNVDKLPRLKGDPHEFDSDERIHHRSYHGGGNIDGCGMAPGHGCKNYTDEYWLKLRRSYYANVALIDDQCGEIIKAAREKWGGDLLIVFTADHGEMAGNHGLWGKHNCGYEDVWNIPLLVQYPNGSSNGRISEKVQLTDLFATFIKVAGGEGFASDGIPLDERVENGGCEYLFAEGEGYVSVSDGRYKYIRVLKPGEDYRELIDLAADPDEYVNLIGDPEYAAVQARLLRALSDVYLRALLP